MSQRVKAQCKTGFSDYKYFCKRFTQTVSCLTKLTSDPKLKNESLAELEDLSRYFIKSELELVVYMNDEADWKSIRAKFVSSPGEEKNRVALREERQEWVTPHKESKITWELLENNLKESIKRKAFICVVASNNQQKLEQIAKDISRSTHPEINQNQENGIIFYDTRSDKNVSLLEMIKSDFGLTSEKLPGSKEVNSLYDRVESLQKTRIETMLGLLLKFIQSYLPRTKEGPFVDLYDIDKSSVENVEEKEGLWKIMYEVIAWMRCMKLNIPGVDVPAIPKLPIELQRELLRLEGVEGCGTIWGKLTLHVTAVKMERVLSLVPGILHKYSYTAGHRVHIFLKREIHADGKIKPGSKMSVKLTEEGKMRLLAEMAKDKKDVTTSSVDGDKFNCGTVGFFVADKLPRSNPDASEDIYGITCAHCVKDCEGNIEVANVKFSSIANTIPHYEPDAIDIAAVKVDERIKRFCTVKVTSEIGDDGAIDDWFGGEQEWSFYEGEAGDIGLDSVFKKGYVTDITKGTVLSNDYRTRTMEELIASGKNFDDMFNILIEPRPGSDEEFSKGGDSGAAVCAEFPDGSLKVISILQGAIHFEDEQGNRQYRFSYSSHMKKSLKILMEKILEEFGQAVRFDVPNF